MKPTFSAAAALAATFSIRALADSIPTCGPNKLCPSDTPCCSQYGLCGVGAYCLGGCDPQYSHSLESCVAAPACKSEDYKLTSLNGITQNTQYLGDASKSNWVSSGTPVEYNGDSVLLTMAPNTVGTLLMSTHYVWYGKISATMTSSQGAGVVTAFIMMSDVKDEIDFEFVGVDLEHAQSNYYFQGITDYDNELKLEVSNTVQNVHTYTIDWQPDSVSWAIDGVVMRTKNRNETWNATTNQYHFPQTPARVELSLWPAGLQANGQGTVAWAGGLVDWNSNLMQNGYYYATVHDVSVECYDPPQDFNQNHGSNAYYYTSNYGTNDTVAMGNNNTVLASLYATGENPNVDPNASASASGSNTASSAKMTATPQTVPGVSGGGNSGNPGAGTGPGTSGNSNSNGGNANAVGSASGGPSSGGGGSGGSGFTQGGSTTGSSGAGKVSATVAGSAVALLGFFVAALML